MSDSTLASLAQEILDLESETFEIADYTDTSEAGHLRPTNSSAPKTCSTTTDATSCSA